MEEPDMSIENPVYNELVKTISPIISIGVGSAICTVCLKQGLSPERLTRSDLQVLKPALSQHYRQFWKGKVQDLDFALSALH
jgi:hypothetical protein